MTISANSKNSKRFSFSPGFTLMNAKRTEGFTLMKAKRTEGFTLIELLVVISIIGVLVAVATISFSSSQKQARDVKRKSDLKFHQNGVEVFANKYGGMYPMWSSGTDASGSQFCNGSLGLANCPLDPRAKDGYIYHYQSDGSYNDGRAQATKYILWSQTESPAGYWIVCSSGTIFYATVQPSIDSCP